MGAPEFIDNFIDRDKFKLIFSDEELNKKLKASVTD